MSAPSKWQSRNTFCGRAAKSGCQRLSKWIARKSHERKRHDASAKRSKRALRKSTPRSVARVIATTRSGATSGAGSAEPATTSSGFGSGLSGSGSLGALSGWDTAARREPLIAKAERLEDVEAGLHFHHRILGERDADRVPDAFVEEHAHARGRPDRARQRGARLGHAEMQRVRHEFREAPVRGDHDRHLERLDADDDVVEVEVLEDLDLAHREVDHALRLVAQVARLAVTDRAVVHADTDRRPLLLRLLGDLAHAVLVVDVPGVETQLVDLRVERHERKAG